MSQVELASGASISSPNESIRCRELANQWIRRWTAGESADAAAAIEAEPGFRNHKTIQLDLAYEEYCLRTEKGETVDMESFCARFPAFRVSLERRLHVHQLLDSSLNMLRQDEWPEPGESVLGYTVLQELGRGAFARVYLATEDDIGDRLVAIKVTRFGGEEADRLGRLEHPNIVPIHSVKRKDGTTIICMPFLGTATLTDLLDVAAHRHEIWTAETILETALREDPMLDRSPPSSFSANQSYIDGLLQLMIRVAKALKYSHGQGIYHLDLKPSNILLSRNGEPMLLDFNLSHDASRDEPERMGGTLPYMSPEQLIAVFFGEEQKIDERSDVFAFGIVLSQLFLHRFPAGKPPVGEATRENVLELLARYKDGVKVIRDGAGERVPHVCKLIEQCLSFSKRKRPTLDQIITTLNKERKLSSRIRRQYLRRPILMGVGAITTSMALGFFTTYSILVYLERHDRLIEESLDAYRKGNYRFALSLLNDEEFLNTDNQNALVLRAYCQARLRLFIPAGVDVERAADDSKRGLLFAIAAEFFLDGGSARRCLKCAAKAIKHGFDSCSLRIIMSNAHLANGHLARALDCLDKALRLDPESTAAMRERSFRLWQIHRLMSKARSDSMLVIAAPDVVRLVNLDPGSESNFVVALLVARRGSGRIRNGEFVLKAVEQAMQSQAINKAEVMKEVERYERSRKIEIEPPYGDHHSPYIDLENPPLD